MTLHDHQPRRVLLLVVAAIALTIGAPSARGDVVTFTTESAYLAELAARGYGVLVEGFGGPDWDQVRSDYPVMNSAPSISSQGITWTGNDEISTNLNWGRTGWGIFTVLTGPWTVDALYGQSEGVLVGMGGWFDSNPDFGSDIAFIIDGEIVATRNTAAGHTFLGVISSCGFTSFDIVDLHKAAAWGADDFTFGIAAIVDCDGNGRDDACDVADGTATDCNGNAVLDECELAAGTIADCDGNGVPDPCDVVTSVELASGSLSPIGWGSPQSFTILAPPPAAAPVVMTLEAYANLGGAGDRIDIDVNGVPIGSVFDLDGSDCPEVAPDQSQLVVDPSTFNAAVAGGDAVIGMTATAEVDPAECDEPSTIAITVGLPVSSAADQDGDGVPDVCQACPADLDDSGDVAVADLLALLGTWGACAGCPADLDQDGAVGTVDLLALLAAWGVCP